VRILIVTQYFWPESFRINDLALALAQRGHEVEVLTGMPNYPAGRLFPGYGPFRPASERFQGMPVKRVPLVTRGGSRNWRLALNYLSFAVSASLLGPLRCRGNYDLVFVFEMSPITVVIPGVVMKAVKRAPVILWVQDLWPESLSATGAVTAPWILRAVRRVVDFLYRRCELVLVSSKGFTGHVLASGIGEKRVAYLPNWAESLYRPLSVAPEPVLSRMPPGFRVMFAGNIGSAQSFDTIVAAAERLKDHSDVHWVVLGSGNMKPWVEQEVRRRGLENQFHLLGQHPVESMPEWFAAADALLVTLRPDPVFALTVPSKVQSYLACGRPVIAAIDGEGGEIVAECGAGFSCPAGDPEALAAAVLRMRDMPAEQRTSMGRNARAHFEANFERTLLLDRLERMMLEVAGRERGQS
jgi:glycosyltransferase involved in cell wall biosynthesis